MRYNKLVYDKTIREYGSLIKAFCSFSGRTRLEPVAIVILSCIMASASVVMIRESIEGIVNKTVGVDLSAVSISLVAGNSYEFFELLDLQIAS